MYSIFEFLRKILFVFHIWVSKQNLVSKNNWELFSEILFEACSQKLGQRGFFFVWLFWVVAYTLFCLEAYTLPYLEKMPQGCTCLLPLQHWLYKLINKNGKLKCIFCGKKWHIKETWWKLHGHSLRGQVGCTRRFYQLIHVFGEFGIYQLIHVSDGKCHCLFIIVVAFEFSLLSNPRPSFQATIDGGVSF